MNQPKMKCNFCPFRSKYFHKMFNGRPVCLCCAMRRRIQAERLANARPVFRGRPEHFTREEAMIRLQEVRRAQRDIGYEAFKAMVAQQAAKKTATVAPQFNLARRARSPLVRRPAVIQGAAR